MEAARDNSNPEVVKVLLAAGAEVNVESNDGETALVLAEDDDHAKAAKLLRAAGATLSKWARPAPSPLAPPTEVTKPFTNSIGMEFVPIPAGGFWMGSTDDDEDAFGDEKPSPNSPVKNSFLFQNMGANPLILLGVILVEQRFSTGC